MLQELHYQEQQVVNQAKPVSTLALLSESGFQELIDQSMTVLESLRENPELTAQEQAEMTLKALHWMDQSLPLAA
jgi:hypothetical protein